MTLLVVLYYENEKRLHYSFFIIIIDHFFSITMHTMQFLPVFALSAVSSDHERGQALVDGGRGGEPDVGGRPALRGSHRLPEHAVVSAAADHPGALLPLAGTEPHISIRLHASPAFCCANDNHIHTECFSYKMCGRFCF